MALRPVSVSQLNNYIKRQLALDPILGNVPVTGEISGLKKHSSGHWYFTLKDENSRLNCFLPRDRAERLRYDISDGMQIVAVGSVSVYERGGYYSLQIRDIEVEGEGDLAAAFENLKKKLEAEGLFAPERKRPLPSFPTRIGVVTSPTGAAIRDIVSTVRRRSPYVSLLLCPCLVQGPEAAASIASGIETLNERFPDLDLLIVGRGGGSIEDLWAFNEEKVARAVRASKIPVISAVGHESDVVISDLAADVRGVTPTAAAELAVPHFDGIRELLRSCSPERNYALLAGRARDAETGLRSLKQSCDAQIVSILKERALKLELLKMDIDAASPNAQLARGYAIARGADGRRISSVAGVAAGDGIEVTLSDGTLDCVVKEVRTHG